MSLQITRERLLLGIFIALLILILLIGALIGLVFQRGLGPGQTTVGDETPAAQSPGQPTSGGFAPIPPVFLPTDSTGGGVAPTQGVGDAGGTGGQSSTEGSAGGSSGGGSGGGSSGGGGSGGGFSQPTAPPRPTNPPPATIRPLSPTNTPTQSSGGGGGGGGGGGNTTQEPTEEPTDQPTDEPTDTPTDTPTEVPTTPPPPSLVLPEDPLERVNAYRTLAGVGLITENLDMSLGALKHAEYMVGNRRLTYFEDPSNPLYSPEGAAAATESNLWFGNGIGLWQPWEPIDEWMMSPFHRLWILYPQAAEMGYGFHEGESPILNGGGSAAALQVFGGWDSSIPFLSPLKYPADGQEDIPPLRYGVSLQFPVYTANPTFSLVTWEDEDGNAVAFRQFDPATHTYMRDYGNAIFLLPNSNLAASTTYTVHMVGVYNSKAFDLEWSFTTGG